MSANTTSYTVNGMTCAHCVSSVKEEVAEIPGVADVDVDLASGSLRITSDAALDDTRVREAVEEAGYALAPTGS